MAWLLIYLLVISLYDLRTRRIPNWSTYPLILAGIIAHFPGNMDLWLACFLLLSAWASGGMGAGDVKLWMAVLWALPEWACRRRLMRSAWLLLPLLLFVTAWTAPVQAQSGSNCVFNADGSITCTVSGGSQGGNHNGNGNGQSPASDPVTCAPGETQTARLQTYEPEAGGTCTLIAAVYDLCSGEVMAPGDLEYGVACPVAAPTAVQHPCTTLVVTAGGITCDTGSDWSLKATVHFPQNYLDVRPYPATLVRWPTALRNGGQPDSSGSGRVGYISNGGGSA